MNNRFGDGWWRYAVVPAVALLFSVAANAAPRGADEAMRGTGKSGTEVIRLVTGDPTQINAVVAGTPPTAILAITPVPVPAGVTPPNPYPPGTLIIGNELRAEVGGFRAWFNVQLSNWDPDGDGSPKVRTFQLKSESWWYYDSDLPGDQPDLAHAVVPCLSDAECVAAFGESWAKCAGPAPLGDGNDFCNAAYLDILGTGRADSWCAPDGGGCNVGGAAPFGGPTFFAVSADVNGRPDGGIVYYGGTLVLDIPAGAKGKYTGSLNTDTTFIAAPGSPPVIIPTLAETSFIVNIVTGSCCFGQGTPGARCMNWLTQAECAAKLGPRVFTPGRLCSEGSCVTLGQCELHEDAKLTGSDAAAYDLLGLSVSVSGNVAIVGASGSAYVYRFNGSTWAEEQKLTASDAANQDIFGASVSVSGDVAVVGAYGDDCAAGIYCGSAYVYRFNGSTWLQEAKLTASDASHAAYFGISVGVSGDVAVVGAYSDDCGPNDDCGSAYVYRFNPNLPEQWVEEQKLTASPPTANARFGRSVSVSGDKAVIGTSHSAYLFRFNGSTWVEEQELSAPVTTFGNSVSISGDVIFVGAYGDGCAAGCCCGSTYVYRFIGSTWAEEQKLTASDAAESDYFGESVSVSGDVAVVGAYHNDCWGGAYCGSAYFYRFNGTDWVLETKLTSSDAAEGDAFGVSVSVSGDVAVVGAYGDDCAAGSSCGSAYVFGLGSLPSPSDCNANRIADECDIASGTSADCNENGVPDECQQLPCPPVLGACCETISGECMSEVVEADCQGTHRVWTSGASCSEASCFADTGACCNRDPFGPCTEDTELSDCQCPMCTWHKLQACAAIECAPTPIPTVSEWGLAIMTLLLLTGAKIFFTRRTPLTPSP